MSRIYKGVFPIAGLLVLLSLAAWLNTMRQLNAARQEMAAVTSANELLRKTLGEMAIAITAKDRQIDRLEHSACSGQAKPKPGALKAPDRRKVSRSDLVAGTSVSLQLK